MRRAARSFSSKGHGCRCARSGGDDGRSNGGSSVGTGSGAQGGDESRYGFIGWVRERCLAIVVHPHFAKATTACIVLNLLALCLWWAPFQPDPALRSTAYLQPAHFWTLWAANLLLTAVFTVELSLKLVAIGPRSYLQDELNIFDLGVVLIALVDTSLEVAAAANGESDNASFGISVLRSLRILRLLRLLRAWHALGEITDTLFRSVRSMVYLVLLLLLFIFVFALLGEQATPPPGASCICG